MQLTTWQLNGKLVLMTSLITQLLHQMSKLSPRVSFSTTETQLALQAEDQVCNMDWLADNITDKPSCLQGKRR